MSSGNGKQCIDLPTRYQNQGHMAKDPLLDNQPELVWLYHPLLTADQEVEDILLYPPRKIILDSSLFVQALAENLEPQMKHEEYQRFFLVVRLSNNIQSMEKFLLDDLYAIVQLYKYEYVHNIKHITSKQTTICNGKLMFA